MAHFSIASRASSRTLSALAVLAMAAMPAGAVANVSSPVPTVSVASAEQNYTNQVTVTPNVVRPGATITINGTDFAPRAADAAIALKLDGGAVAWPQNQPEGVTVTPGYIAISGVPNADGSFSAKVNLPNLADGEHTVSLLGGSLGSDPKPRVAVTVKFKVAAPVATSPTVEATKASVATNGAVSVPFSAKAFTAGSTISVTVDGQPAGFAAGRGPAVSSVKVEADGTVSGSVSIAAGKALAGSHELVFTSSTGEKATAQVEVGVGASFGTGAVGSKVEGTISNLPTGAVVKGVGVDGANWLASPVTVTSGNQVTIKDLQIPASTKVGEPISVTYVIDGKETTQATAAVTTPSATPLNTEAYQVTSTTVPNGNYQSAANAKGEVFITASVGRPPIKESTLVKGHYDASGKFVIDKQITPAAAADGKGVNGVYGVAVDDANGYVWTANTRQNTVAVYKQSDLSLVKQYPANAVTHARSLRVIGDSVYVTEAARGKGGGIKVFNAKQLDAAPTTIDLPEGAVPMDFDVDSASGRLFTVDLKLNKAYVIDTKNSNQVTSYDLPGANGASGVAYDPANNRLFVANQSSNNAVVLDLSTGKVIADIPTGSQALGAVYSNGYVYVGNRTAGTVSVINASSLKVEAILPTGTNPNHLSVNPDGSVNVLDKAPSNNQIFRIARKGATPAPTTPAPTPTASPTAAPTSPANPTAAPTAAPVPTAPASPTPAPSTPAPSSPAKPSASATAPVTITPLPGKVTGAPLQPKGAANQAEGARPSLAKTGAASIVGLAALALIGAGAFMLRSRRRA
jgi:hypothetical protein